MDKIAAAITRYMEMMNVILKLSKKHERLPVLLLQRGLLSQAYESIGCLEMTRPLHSLFLDDTEICLLPCWPIDDSLLNTYVNDSWVL